MKFKKQCAFILFFVLLSLLNINTKIFAELIPLNENEFKIMGVAQQGKNNIKLDWTELKNANYQIYQSVNGNNYQTMSTFNIENGTDKVKVLNVYNPNYNGAALLETWMETNGYGKGIIEVDKLTITEFNANPWKYLSQDGTSTGTFTYDVLFFGNNDYGFDLNANSVVAVEKYILAGKGCIVGHDNIVANGNHGGCKNPYFWSLRNYFNVSAATDTNYSNTMTTSVVIQKKGLFTTYPWNIGEIGTILNIPTTHMNGQYANGDIWLTLNRTNLSSQKLAYLTTHNNCAMVQTGHSNGAATIDEQKILANLIFYCDQVTTETSFIDNSGQDFALPNKPNVKIDANNHKLLMEATDNGTTYQYKAKAYVDGQTIESQPISVENISGIKGYYYIINNNPNEKIMNVTGNFTNGEIDLLSITSDTNYLHIAAVDNANNVSETTSLSMDDIIGINASNIAYTINATNDTTNVDLSIVASGVNVNYQWEMCTENGEWQEINGATLENYSMDITNMNELLYYRCRVYNNSLSMYSNEVIVNPTTYDKTYVYVTQASTFSVKIPKVMILSGQTGKGEYVVSVNGNVSGLASVNVIPNDFAIMKDIANVKTSFNAIVTQNKTLFNANEIINGTTTNGLVDGSALMTAGNWKGNFNFAIDFEDEKAKVNSIASVNQNDDGTTIGYDKEQEQSTAYSHISFVN